jgi:hypothetical protein
MPRAGGVGLDQRGAEVVGEVQWAELVTISTWATGWPLNQM